MTVTRLDLLERQIHFTPEDENVIAWNNQWLQLYGQIAFRSQISSESGTFSTHDQSLNSLREILDASVTVEDVIRVFDDLIDDWSIIYYQERSNRLFIARDVFGRKSLLCAKNDDQMLFSPVVTHQKLKWMDVPAGAIMLIDLSSTGSYNTRTKIFYTFDVEQHILEQYGIVEKICRSAMVAKLTLCRSPAAPTMLLDMVANELIEKLRCSVRRIFNDVFEEQSSISLSFSGGVDSLLLAHLIVQCSPPNAVIDFVNVCFGDKEVGNFDQAPDRPQSIHAFNFLQTHYPNRRIRLILCNVELDELQRCRTSYIAQAIAPSYLVLDDSIGCVQWFAARGHGYLYDGSVENTSEQIRSDAKVVAVGSGADELFGGYMRHKGIYNRSGREAVLNELQAELARIAARNLSRDDRVVSTHGKYLRSPFLSDVFVEWVLSLPLELKSDFSMPRGVGEKILLREALKLLGTPKSLYCSPKRAMQFGTRIAKLESRQEKGDDLCTRLMPLHF